MTAEDYTTDTVRVAFDGAEGIAFWFINPDTEEASKLMFEDVPGFFAWLDSTFVSPQLSNPLLASATTQQLITELTTRYQIFQTNIQGSFQEFLGSRKVIL